MEIQEIIRRWQAGEGYRQIASGTGLSRNTVRKYLAAAKAEGIARDGAVPGEDQLSRLAAIGQPGPRQAQTPSEDLLAPWADQIHQWLTGDRLQLTRIHELLLGRGCPVSYQSLRRFVQKRNWRQRSRTTVRMEDTAPGEVAELDFGRLGLVHDPETGRRRTVWALIVALSHSRHCFVWPTFSQKLEEVIAGLEADWAFFGGIPKYLVIDNFPAAVAGADALHPRLTLGFLEYSQHRGFITDPARVRHPKDKPHVERGVQYVKERFFKGGDFTRLAEMRDEAARWCRDIAGQRIHGATRRKPLQVFRDEELPALAPWDGEPYEVTDWRTAKVHPDHHVACQYALYSVPSALCPPGQQVEIGLGRKLVQMRALVVTAPAELRELLDGLTIAALAARCKGFRPGRLDNPTSAAKYTLRSLACRHHQFSKEIHDLKAELERLTRTAEPALVCIFGVGPDTAAALLITAGSNLERLHSEAAFASFCGVNPIPASSGKTNRHRLNRGGDRQANAALYRIVMVRLRHDCRTREYMCRRTGEGMSKAEVIRCLKRYVARQAFSVIKNSSATAGSLA